MTRLLGSTAHGQRPWVCIHGSRPTCVVAGSAHESVSAGTQAWSPGAPPAFRVPCARHPAAPPIPCAGDAGRCIAERGKFAGLVGDRDTLAACVATATRSDAVRACSRFSADIQRHRNSACTARAKDCLPGDRDRSRHLPAPWRTRARTSRRSVESPRQARSARAMCRLERRWHARSGIRPPGVFDPDGDTPSARWR